jgi:hypothetical protein
VSDLEKNSLHYKVFDKFSKFQKDSGDWKATTLRFEVTTGTFVLLFIVLHQLWYVP